MPIIERKLIANRSNRPALRDHTKYALRQLKGIVVHWTANESIGADADAHYRFFNNVSTATSAHFLVDDESIIQIIPDAEVAYHVGANSYKQDGKRIMAGGILSPNYYLIGFEMCVNADGDWSKTYKHAVLLAAYLLHKYRFGLNDLYRHFDVTGKDCPRMFLKEADWEQFRNDVGLKMRDMLPDPLRLAKVNAHALNVRSGPSTRYPVQRVLRQNEEVRVYGHSGNWQQIGRQQWVYGSYLDTTVLAKDGLIQSKSGANIRLGAGMGFGIIDILPNGAWVTVLAQEGEWLQIGHGNHWVHQSLVKLVEVQKAQVIGTPELNVRRGPSTRFDITRVLRLGDEVEIFQRDRAWAKIGEEEWAYGGFLTLK